MTLECDKEYIPDDETEWIDKTVRDSDAIVRMGHGPVLRGQHAKGTLAVRASFVVDPERPAQCRFGVFEETRTFDATVRFSNGRGRIEPDSKPDARGMSIKVHGVTGQRAFMEETAEMTQDFVMINYPVFAFKNVQQYAKFTSLKRRLMSLIGPKGNDLAQVLFMGVPWRMRQLLIGLHLKRHTLSPLAERYWSMSPVRLGPHAVKFTAKPQTVDLDIPRVTELVAKEPNDFLSRVAAQQLRKADVRFDFMVQFQRDPVAMPVEDPTVEWNETASPFAKVATVIIDKVDLDSAESREFQRNCEGMSFNPWHALAAHQPLGGINRLRKKVYESNAKLRRESPKGA